VTPADYEFVLFTAYRDTVVGFPGLIPGVHMEAEHLAM